MAPYTPALFDRLLDDDTMPRSANRGTLDALKDSIARDLEAFLPQQWTTDAEAIACKAKFYGALAGIVAGAYDIYNSVAAFMDGKNLPGTLCGLSGVSAVGSAVAAYCGAVIFWPVLIFSVVVGIAIALASATALQEWVSRCYFSVEVSKVRADTQGKPPFKPYPYVNAAEEANSFKSAMGF